MAPKVSAVRDDLVADTVSPCPGAGSKTDKSRILRLLSASENVISSLAHQKTENVALQQLACAQELRL